MKQYEVELTNGVIVYIDAKNKEEAQTITNERIHRTALMGIPKTEIKSIKETKNETDN